MDIKESTLYEVSDKYKELRDIKADLEFQLREISEQVKSTEVQLIQLMIDNDLTSFKRKDVMFTQKKITNRSAIEETKDEFYDELKKRGFNDWFSVNGNTLKARIKEQMEENGGAMPEWLSTYIKETEMLQISMRKS